MGKWKALKGLLPAWAPEADYQAKIDAVKRAWAENDTKTLSSIFERLRSLKEAIEKKALARVDLQLEAVTQLLVERAVDLNLTALPMDSGVKYLLIDQPHTSVADRTKVREWFTTNDQAEILSPPWQTLNAIVKAKLEAGADPDDVAKDMGVKIFMKTTLQRRKH